jgi:hypothetical protein
MLHNIVLDERKHPFNPTSILIHLPFKGASNLPCEISTIDNPHPLKSPSQKENAIFAEASMREARQTHLE